jgi:hypothetical protein
MFNPEDIQQIKSRGSQIATVEQQIINFQTGFPFLKLTEAASYDRGIIALTSSEIEKYIAIYDAKVAEGLSILKFVPASGAASRMFKSLFSALEKLQKGSSDDEIKADKEVHQFLEQLNQFAFYEDLKKLASSTSSSLEKASAIQILSWVLLEQGLNYGNLPKGLLKFHTYPAGSRTPLEEHLVEGAMYSCNNLKEVNIHFTVSPEHQALFEKHVNEVCANYEQLFGVKYIISFSQQKPSTDTIAVTPENEPFRNNDGSLLFRPAGHGALLENLNDLDADLIFIKNIDNVVPDALKKPTVDYKKALAGILLDLQDKIFYYQKMLKEHHNAALESAFYAEAANFLENVLNVTPPENQYYSEKEELYPYFVHKFNRPIRVCGMVKNLGEPGGGPFLARNRDGSVSLQIVESSQIDFSDAEQAKIAHHASHFNPVDLVCAVKNYEGEKFNLLEFSDPKTGFISSKSKDGKELKAQELPGLWNGAMSDWNTIFVEVPVETFNPVKTVNDLLRKEHQAK